MIMTMEKQKKLFCRAYNRTMEKQSDDPEDFTNEPLPSMSEPIKVEDAVASTLTTPFVPIIPSSKSKAQKQREYRQRIAASRTPAQAAAARKSKTERQRNNRLRQAANLAIANGFLEVTISSSSRSGEESNNVQQQSTTTADQPDEHVNLTNEPLFPAIPVPMEVQEAVALQASAPKTRAQIQRDYRQRIAASKTPAQAAAARKARNVRDRNHRLCQAADLAFAGGSLEATTTSSSRSGQRLNTVHIDAVQQFTDQQLQTTEPAETTVQPSTSSDQIEVQAQSIWNTKWASSSMRFKSTFLDNDSGYTCSVGDRLSFGNDLKPITAAQQKLLQSPEPEQPSSSQQPSTPPFHLLDHTYASLHEEPASTSSSLHISVKVEVEEFDESIINEPVSSVPVPLTPQIIDHKRKTVSAFKIDLEKMYKISEHINWSSTNLADKFLSTELKNIWGRVLKPDDDNDPYNIAIQMALSGWGRSLLHGGHKLGRESPLFYQCLICNMAWWYLSPFRDHIRTHDHREIVISHVLNEHESNIVASHVDVTKPIYIPCEGDCYRCGNPFSFHVKPFKMMYHCKKCLQGMETCTMVRQHDLVCRKGINMRIGENVCQCHLCLSLFYSNQALDMHMVKSHRVRSDIPTPFAFKTCNVCEKKYHYFLTHMCKKSSLNAACTYCYRKFPTKTLQQAHCEIGNNGIYKCRICDKVLAAICMETEHMVSHTDNYRMAYKCINYACPPIILFPDERSIKLHKVMYHFQKHDKRRTYFEKVLVPQQCVKLDYEQVMNRLGEVGGIELRKVPVSQGPSIIDWCAPSAGKQTNKQADNDNLIIMRQELNEPVVIDCRDNSQNDSQVNSQNSQNHSQDDSQVNSQNSQNHSQDDKQVNSQNSQVISQVNSQSSQDNSQDDSRCGPMDYAEMLSKVFKMAVAEHRPRRAGLGPGPSTPPARGSVAGGAGDALPTREGGNGRPEIHTQIKYEPLDVDHESLIDIKEHPIIIKQEPGEYYQTDSCQNDSQSDTCETYNSLEDILQTDTSQIDSCQNITSLTETDSMLDGITVKTEPQDFEIDTVFETDFTAVKIEPEDVKQEFLEFTEVDEYADGNFITAEAILGTPETTNAKTVENNPNSLLKNTQQGNIFASHSTYLLKPNDASTQQTKLNPRARLKSILKRTKTDDTNGSPKTKMAKFDANGIRIRKLYTCGKCGYTENHKLFRMHQKSSCDLDIYDTPQRNEKYMCTKCDTSFCSLKSYVVHFTLHGYEVLQCPCCNMKFEMMKDLLPHFHKHVKMNYVNCWTINEKMETTKKQNRCQMCREIVDPEWFFTHWERHLEIKVENAETAAPMIADKKITTTNKQTLPPATLHLALQQLRSVTRDKDCEVCGRKFNRRYDVKRHLIEHLLLDAYTKKDKTPSMQLRCQICLSEFPRNEQYKFHMREHGALPVYRCELCDKTFSDSSNFAKHKKIHNMRVLICDTCQKKFHTKFSLEKHIKMHMTTEPIKCDLCDKQFYAASQYNKHLNVRHKRSIKFRCVVCDIAFDSLRAKWDHAWAVHKERKQQADCPICYTKFRKYQDVKYHARKDHKVELSFFNIKSETGVMNSVNTICKIKKRKKNTSIVSKYPQKNQ